jgi:hypothetical protein
MMISNILTEGFNSYIEIYFKQLSEDDEPLKPTYYDCSQSPVLGIENFTEHKTTP